MKKTIRPTVYDSAIDLWVALLIMLTPVLSAVIGCYLLLSGNAEGAMYLFLVGAVSLLVTLAFTLPCRYTILDDAVSIRCGILFYQIALAEIESVEPSASWRNGPALSMRRVKIQTSKRIVIVSPRQREEFVEDLLAAVRSVRSVESD